MSITCIAGYKFISLENISELREQFFAECKKLSLLGTILLSPEGINIMLSGASENIILFQTFLKRHIYFSDITFNESQCSSQPYKRLKVKIKNEIITFRQDSVNPVVSPAGHITPQEFKQWLDEKRDITLLDTRNEYEVRFGTFENAINPNLNNFSEFVKTSEKLEKDKPVVMFCTGGIRCEKAAVYLLNQGFQ
jgi:UPF0176 protein